MVHELPKKGMCSITLSHNTQTDGGAISPAYYSLVQTNIFRTWTLAAHCALVSVTRRAKIIFSLPVEIPCFATAFTFPIVKISINKIHKPTAEPCSEEIF